MPPQTEPICAFICRCPTEAWLWRRTDKRWVDKMKHFHPQQTLTSLLPPQSPPHLPPSRDWQHKHCNTIVPHHNISPADVILESGIFCQSEGPSLQEVNEQNSSQQDEVMWQDVTTLPPPLHCHFPAYTYTCEGDHPYYTLFYFRIQCSLR